MIDVEGINLTDGIRERRDASLQLDGELTPARVSSTTPQAAFSGFLGKQEFWHVHIHVVDQVRTGIILGEGLARPDVIGVRRAVELDELGCQGPFVVLDLGLHVLQRVALRADGRGHDPGLLESHRGVFEGSHRAFVQLLEVTLRIGAGHHVGVDVQGQAVARKAQRCQAGLGVVEHLLDLLVDQGQLTQLRDRGAIDLLDALVRRVGIFLRQHGVAHHPVQVGPLAHTAGPVVEAPMPFRGDHPVGVLSGLAKTVPADGIPRTVRLTENQLQDLETGLADRSGRRRKLALIDIVHLDGLAEDGHGLGPGHPIELVVEDQTVVTLERREVVAVGVAMALRECLGRIRRVDDAVGVEVLDVVVLGVDDLARVDAPGEVPIQPVVGRRRLHPGLHEVVAPAQQGQFLLQERGQLAGEAVLGSRHAALGFVTRSGSNGWIVRIGHSLVTQQRVQVVEVAGHEQERVVGRAVVDPGVDAQLAASPEHGLVDFDEAGVVDVLQAERDGALPAATGLADDADVGVDRVVVEILDALLERVDASQHPLDPALGQLRLGPRRPLADERVRRVDRPVPHHQVVVGKDLHAGPTQRVPGQAGSGLQGLPLRHAGVHRRRGAVDRSPDAPLVFEFVEATGQVRGVLQGQQLIERIGRWHHLELSGPEASGDAQDMHRHRLAGGREGPPIADDHRHHAITRAGGAQRIGVDRRFAAADLHHVADGDIRLEAGVRHELARHVRVFLEGVDHGDQPVHQVVPLGLLVRGRCGAEVEHRLQVLPGRRAAQDVELQVLFAHRLVLELTFQHQGPPFTHVRVEVHAGGQMRRKVGKIGESLVGLREDARGQPGQLDRSQGGGLHASRVDEHGAGSGQGEVGGDGLLVEHLDTRLAADGRKAVERPGQGLPRLQDRRQDGPRRAVNNVERGGGLGIRHAGEGSGRGAPGSQVGHDAADRDRWAAGPSEALFGLVVEAHPEAVGIRGSLGQERRTAGKGHRLSVHGLARDGQGTLGHLGATGLDGQRERRGPGMAIGQAQPHVDDLDVIGPSGRRTA